MWVFTEEVVLGAADKIKRVVEWPEKPTGAGEASVEALPPLGDQSGFSSSTGKAVGVAGSELEADGGLTTK